MSIRIWRAKKEALPQANKGVPLRKYLRRIVRGLFGRLAVEQRP